jgi:hypothetical protein
VAALGDLFSDSLARLTRLLLLIENSGTDGWISFAQLMGSTRRPVAVFTTIVRAFVAYFIDGLGFVSAGLTFVG